ncbi:sensor histidine kinase [Shewanella fidelis]|uniref:histidine kinase n=1 Tax=Shewanella fidelis TaxID=173509 RepID=A0AAW8NPW9_9GAMM|nr:ATP-binding protein [Shewanella fidelis]MDR8524947.1 ATP-binding protein [Shewanella fidelis]MDW4811018.1 ATP-binding protein [Shewanella fidelis]MDW4815203.1 ATP-binding protein [Shewanella fidelis]MDW4819293.1 ATP-binding protein [Shewanella fidelis]MDW4823029.1 ATP-binding protein [Shewanella fidelis]
MKRLFISLYFLLSLGVLGIGWALDNLWQSNVDDKGAHDAPLIALAQVLSAVPVAQRQAMLDSIESNPKFPLTLLDAEQVAFSSEQLIQADKIIATPYDLNHELHFVAVGEQVLMAGPIELDPRASLRNLYNIFFYLLLGFIVLIWVWPLSKDLKILGRATKEFGQAKWNTRIKLAKSSQVLPLADTFNDMAAHISALIENQKHLSNAVSHEIRTPLARLKFALALLPQYCQPDSDLSSRQRFLDDMQLDIKEMENLLQELLTYASLETQRESLTFERCDLTSLVSQTIRRLQTYNPTPIILNAPDEAIFVSAEPSLVERALQNLITNAQRFSTDDIQVKIAQSNQAISVSVTDHGEGILAEDQTKIFEPFYRSASSKNGNKGHGLGLAIIKRIMERHHGEVTLESRPGFTCFTLIWPIRQQKD